MENVFFRLTKEIEDQGLNVHGIEVFLKGENIFRKMFDEDIRYPIYSAAKSFTATAVGIACDNGKMSVDAPLAYYIEKHYIQEMPAHLREGFEKLPVSRFLKMSVCGYPFRPYGNDWLETILQTNIDYSAAPDFSYTNVSAYLVGVACENAVGGNLMSYLKPHLFDPLEINTPDFQTDPQERFYGATGMYLTVNELSRLGQLYLQKGTYNSERILSENWVNESTKLQINNSDGGYGYFFWRKDDHFSISGKWGQKCLIYPEKDLVITYLGDMPEDSEKMLKLAEEILPHLLDNIHRKDTC